ncbi:MAG: hypothetical protein ABIF71_14970 [Planctomycetota bacterium]
MMRSLVMVMFSAVLAGGCGAPSANKAELPLRVAYKFPKEGVQTTGDTGYIRILSTVDFRCEVAYAADGAVWVPIEEKGQPRQVRDNNQTVFVQQVVWRVPEIVTDTLSFRVTAHTSDGRTAEKIVPVEAVIDPFTPQSMCSFNPFAL